MMRPAFFAFAAMIVLAACAGTATPSDVPEQPAPLAGTEWALSRIFGSEPVPGTSVTLEFTDARLFGFAGCNSYGAPYSATIDGSLMVVEVEMTDEGCLEPEGVLVQEGILEQALLGSIGFEQRPDALVFLNDSGREVLRFVPPSQLMVPTELPEPTASLLWSEAVDDRTGLRFAVPCYWEVDIPSGERDPSGMGAITLRNYDDAFVLAHPRGAISEDEGAIKIDLSYIPTDDLGLEVGVSLDEFPQTLVGDSGLEAVEPAEVNGRPALIVTQQGAYGIGHFALVSLQDDLVLLLGSGSFASPDVQGVLNSLTITSGANVVIPSFDPAGPPLGVDAQCMGKVSSAGAEDLANVLQCEGVETGSAESLACDVQTALLARDMQALAGLMSDPFMMGYWG